MEADIITNLSNVSNDSLTVNPSPTQAVYFAFLLLICFVGSIGNVMAIVAVRVEKRLQEVISNYFVINLAVADFVVCSTVVPILMVHMLYAEKLFTPTLCYITATLSGVSCHCAAATMTCIALNRFIATYKFQSYESLVTKKRVYIVIASIWLFAIVNTIPILFAWFEIDYDPLKYVCVCFDGTFPLYYTLGPVFIGHFFPHATTAYCYFRIFRTMNKSRLRVTSYSNQPDENTHAVEPADVKKARWNKHEIQLMKTSIWIIGFFSFCWIPYGILVLLQDKSPMTLKQIFGALCLLSFSMNPIIYGLMSKAFRKAYVKIISSIFCLDGSQKRGRPSYSSKQTQDTGTNWKSQKSHNITSTYGESST